MLRRDRLLVARGRGWWSNCRLLLSLLMCSFPLELFRTGGLMMAGVISLSNEGSSSFSGSTLPTPGYEWRTSSMLLFFGWCGNISIYAEWLVGSFFERDVAWSVAKGACKILWLQCGCTVGIVRYNCGTICKCRIV